MRKIIAFFLSFILLICFSGCASKKLNNKNLTGTWETEVNIKQFSFLTGKFIGGNEDSLPSQYIEMIHNIKLPYRLVFNSDNTCDKMVSKSGVDDFYNNLLDIVLQYYTEQGLLMKYKSQNSDIQTNDDLEEYFNSISTTKKDEMAKIENEINEAIAKSKSDFGFKFTNDKNYYILNKTPQQYTINEDALTIMYDKEITLYCELTDKNTIYINSTYDGNRAYKADITFKRVK